MFKSIQNSRTFLLFFLMLLKIVHFEVRMHTFCKLLDQINQKLETITINLLQLTSQDLFISIFELIINELHLLTTYTSYFCQIINVTWSSRLLQIKRNIFQEQLNTYQVFMLYTQLQWFLTSFILYLSILNFWS